MAMPVSDWDGYHSYPSGDACRSDYDENGPCEGTPFAARRPFSPCRAATPPLTVSEDSPLMKMLFSLKNVLTAKKSLKSYAWYLWY